MIKFDSLSDIRSYLKNEFAMDEEDGDEMVTMLIDSLTSQIEDLKTAITENDSETIGHIGHAIKGSAANVGANYISSIGARLNTPEVNLEFSKCVELTNDLEESLKLLQDNRS